MGNSASVTVNGITLSLADAAKIGDMPEVKAYREQQAKEAEERRIKIGDWVRSREPLGLIFLVNETRGSDEVSGAGLLNFWPRYSMIKITDPAEIATLNRITSRMGE